MNTIYFAGCKIHDRKRHYARESEGREGREGERKAKKQKQGPVFSPTDTPQSTKKSAKPRRRIVYAFDLARELASVFLRSAAGL
jgi:hypothetical protein